jgi:hypothetical protein
MVSCQFSSGDLLPLLLVVGGTIPDFCLPEKTAPSGILGGGGLFSPLAPHPRMQFWVDFAAKPRSVSMGWMWHVSEIDVSCLDDSGSESVALSHS